MTHSPDQSPTIGTIARRAGVSIASVSRVLNDLGGRPETIRAVRRAARELGYVPNSVARSLRARRTGQLVFAGADVTDPICLAMLRETEVAARQANYRLLLRCTDGRQDVEAELLRGLRHRYADGLILCPARITPAHLAELARVAVPVVVCGPVPEGRSPDGLPVDALLADSRVAAGLAVAHLRDTGRHRVAFVGPWAGDSAVGAGGQGPPVEDRMVERCEVARATGAEAARRLLARADPDAIACGSDLVALGVMHALREAGRRVPEDVAVVGVGDTDLARICWPALTSVGIGAEERGALAVPMLLDRLGGADPPPRLVTSTPRLVARDSSRQ
ncbi:MAG TPA: LacI family DNA-binding transcriptional regulator [Mycobacteriales bacterium]|nr:LacI family DNA-binding transcriptional regulator [Mycobacteriales bacterium]